MSRRRATFALLCALAVAGGCAGAEAPAAPPPAAPAPPPPEPRQLESPVDPERSRELRSETRAALAEAREILDGLDEETRRERTETVATVESLVEQGSAALDAGDVERAHNLATKALGLAREL